MSRVNALSIDEFWAMILKPCHYCGREPYNRTKFNLKSGQSDEDQMLYNGIDRVNNNVGYTKSNSVPCCKFCNHMKFHLSKKDFLDHVMTIAKHQKGLEND